MASSPLRSVALAVAATTIAGCSSTRPLPAYQKPLGHMQHQTVRTTAYTHSESDHIKYGQSSATGETLRSEGIRSAAADWSRWPAGTLFRVQETGELYEVNDYGWALAGTNTIDLYKPTRASMNAWGVRRVNIEIQRWGDPKHSLSILSGRMKYAHVRRMVSGIKSDSNPYESLSAPTLTPPTDTIPPATMQMVAQRAEPVPPRQEYASARTSSSNVQRAQPVRPASSSGSGEWTDYVEVRKPFRP